MKRIFAILLFTALAASLRAEAIRDATEGWAFDLYPIPRGDQRDDVGYYGGTADPSSGEGYQAPMGSTYAQFDVENTDPDETGLWLKTGTAATDWERILGSGIGTLPEGTAEGQTLRWDNSDLAWEANSILRIQGLANLITMTNSMLFQGSPLTLGWDPTGSGTASGTLGYQQTGDYLLSTDGFFIDASTGDGFGYDDDNDGNSDTRFYWNSATQTWILTASSAEVSMNNFALQILNGVAGSSSMLMFDKGGAVAPVQVMMNNLNPNSASVIGYYGSVYFYSGDGSFWIQTASPFGSTWSKFLTTASGGSPLAWTAITGDTGLTTVDTPGDTLSVVGGAGVSVAATEGPPDSLTITNTSNIFRTIDATSGTDPVADSLTDTLTLTAGTGITVTGNSTTDTVTIANTGVTAEADTLDSVADRGNTTDQSVTLGNNDADLTTINGDLEVNDGLIRTDDGTNGGNDYALIDGDIYAEGQLEVDGFTTLTYLRGQAGGSDSIWPLTVEMHFGDSSHPFSDGAFETVKAASIGNSLDPPFEGIHHVLAILSSVEFVAMATEIVADDSNLNIGNATSVAGLLRTDNGALGSNGTATAAGDLYAEDALEVDGATVLQAVSGTTLNFTGNATIGDADTDSHTATGNFSHIDGLLRNDDGSAGTNETATDDGDFYNEDALEIDGNTVLGDADTDTTTITGNITNNDGLVRLDDGTAGTNGTATDDGDLYVEDAIENDGAANLGTGSVTIASGGTGTTEFQGLTRVDDGTNGTNGSATAAGDLYVEDTLEVDGSVRGADYYAGSGAQGITETFNFFDVDRGINVFITVEDGLIVGWGEL